VTSPEEWAVACSDAFVPLRVRSAAPMFSASIDQLRLSERVAVSRVASERSEVFRSSRVIAEHPRDDVLVSFHRHGSGAVRQNGREARLRRGSVVLYDTAAPYELLFPGRMAEAVVQVPRSLFGRTAGSLEEKLARPLPSTPSTRALTALACSVASGPDRDPVAEAAVAEAILGLLRAATASAPAPRDSRIDRVALRSVLLAFVDDHLGDPSLSPATLADAHHVSLRLVQQIFAESGTSPAEYIRERRLRRARTLILQGASIGRSASAAGFRDADTFSRAFKRVFGVVPSGYCSQEDPVGAPTGRRPAGQRG